MLKGLLIRQIFMFVDVALAVLTVFVAYQVFTKLFQAPVGAVAGPVAGVDAAPPELPSVGPLESYEIIVASRLFGEAGEQKTEAPPPVDTGADDELPEDTEFSNLKLKGTSFTKIRPNALIEQTGLGADVYEPGQEVIPGQAKLLEVHNRWVILMNLAKNKREILRMDEEDLQLASAPGPPRSSRPRDPGRNMATVRRDELEQELQAMTDNLPDLVNTLNPHPVLDSNGNTVGFTADNIDSVPLAKKLGFRNGDVVKEINGQPIDSLESITSVIEKYQNASDFHVTVLRNGTPTLLRFKLE